jgi:flagellar hook-length control protein FliK
MKFDDKKEPDIYDYRQTELSQDLTRDHFKDNQSAKINSDEKRDEDFYNENKTLRNGAESLQEKQIEEDDEKFHKEIVNEKLISQKGIDDKKNVKLSEEENSVISQLHSETNVKRLMEIVKAVLNGDQKTQDDNFKKLFTNLRSNNDKSSRDLSQSNIKDFAANNSKISDEIINKITKDLKGSIGRELSKVFEDRRSMGKQLNLTDRELKDIVANVIDGIKKNRGKDVIRQDSRHVTNDEIKNDKKNISITEPQIFKKTEFIDNTNFERSSSGDKNSHRDNFSFNSGKLDFSAKTGSDRIENTMKMPDFKETLQELIDKAKISVRDNRNGSFTVRLNPQELGSVNVNLVMKNGVITGKFLVDNEDVKNILLNNIQELKNQLKDAGIEVGEFSVGVDSRHERNLSNNRDEMQVMPIIDSDMEIISAAEIYDTISEVHAGHINMII